MKFANSERDYRICIEESSKYERILIYGAGKYGKILLNWCLEKKIKVEAVCVTSMENNTNLLSGIPVRLYQDVLNDNIPTLFLIGVKEQNEIIDNLSQNEVDYLAFPEWIIEKDVWIKRRYESPIIEVTPIIGCSVNCKYCPQDLLLKEYFKKNNTRIRKMTLEDYIFYVDSLPQNVIVDFSGFVEPFLNKDAIDMMEYTNKKGIDMTLFTTLKNVDVEIAKRIIAIPFKEVVLHLPDDAGNSNIPINNTYKIVLDMIIHAKGGADCSFVTSASCHGEIHHGILPIVEGKMYVSNKMMDRAGNLNSQKENLLHQNISGHIRCTRARDLNHNVLLPDGTLVLCCNDYGMIHELGNLNEKSYEEIMTGNEINNIRAKLNTDNGEILCRKCIYAEKFNDV